MRFLGIILIAFLAAVPALAQNVQTFGSYTCSKPVPCPDEVDVMRMADVYVAGGNACMKDGLGYSNPSGFFDSSGLNSRGCLSATPGAFPKGLGAQLTPNCCVVKSASQCVFHCDLNTQ